MPDNDADPPAVHDPVGFVTQSPLAFALLLVGLYWTVKILRPTTTSRPPRAPYWIPWVGSAVAIGKDPDGFLKSMSKLLGPVFRVKTLGQEMVFVTSPSLISAIYRDTRNYDFVSVRVRLGEQVFAVRKAIVGESYMLNHYMPELHHTLLPSNLKPMVSVYLTSVYDTLLSMVASMDGTSGPLKTFIIPPAYRAACHAGFGLDFPAEKSYPFFKVFDENFHLLVAGLPKFLLSKTWKAWDDLVDLLEVYVNQQEEAGEDMTPFVMVALDGQGRGEWTRRDVAKVLGSQLWALQANAIFTAYWLIAMLLQQSDGLTPLVTEIDEARRQWRAAHPSTQLGPAFFDEITSSSKTLPLLTSAIQETLRYASSAFSMRMVQAPVKLGGHDLLPGDRIVCPTRHIHIDDEIHPHASEFDIRRYLENPRATKDGKPVANHSIPFGGGVSMCEGRHLAMTEIKLFLAILLTFATFDLDEACTTRPDFTWERMGLGVMQPRGDMEVILRKRRL